MELVVFLVIWVLLAFGIGVWAESRGRSGFGFGALSFIFSPILAGVILLIMSDKKAALAAEARRQMERKEEHERQLEEIRAIREAPAVSVQPAAGASSIADEFERIAKLRENGLVTEEEFAALKKKLLGI